MPEKPGTPGVQGTDQSQTSDSRNVPSASPRRNRQKMVCFGLLYRSRRLAEKTRRNATGRVLEGSFTTIVRGVSAMSAPLDDGVPVRPKARSRFSPHRPLAKAPTLRVSLILGSGTL